MDQGDKLSGATVTGALACLLLFAAFLLIILAVRVKSGFEDENSSSCSERGCGDIKAIVDAILNHSADPCNSFDAFVCSRWQTENAASLGGVRATSTQWFMVQRWLNDFRRLLTTGERQLSVAQKALAMYDICTVRGLPATKEVLKAFMNATNLSWPEESASNVNAFAVLLNLAYNWDVPLWFRAVVLPEDANHERRRLIISLNPQMAQWQGILEQLGSVKQYMGYWNSFYEQLASDVENNMPTESDIVSSYKIMRTILGIFLKKDTYADEAPRQFSLDDASKHVTFAENMTQLINENVEYGANFSGNDLLVFAEVRLLQAMNSTFATYSNKELLHHLSWLFVQAHGPIADPFRMLYGRHGSMSEARRELPRYCASQVETSYPMIANALFAVRLRPRTRQFISDQLQNVLDSVVLGIRRATWLDARSRESARIKISRLRTVLWPPDEFLAEDGLTALYRFFPSNESSFIGYWIETRRARRIRRMQDPQYNAELLEAPGSYTLPLVSYVHALNAVFVSMAALTRPLYYGPGTKAMTYGGLGYQYARQVLRAIDSNGASFDEFGRPVATWLSKESSAALQDRAKCYDIMDYDTLLDVAALEVAYNAYRGAPPRRERNWFGDITPAQVFFISVCYASCSQKRLYSREVCGKVVGAFRPFVEAFNCEKRLIPERPDNCTFFY